jgi:hypothetical protein
VPRRNKCVFRAPLVVDVVRLRSQD